MVRLCRGVGEGLWRLRKMLRRVVEVVELKELESMSGRVFEVRVQLECSPFAKVVAVAVDIHFVVRSRLRSLGNSSSCRLSALLLQFSYPVLLDSS